MGKKGVMVSIDDSVHLKAQEKGFNISNVCENALIDKMNLNDILNDNPSYTCSECGKITDEGFVCIEHKKIFCRDCEMSWDTARKCKHTEKDMFNRLHFHRHIGKRKDCLGKTLEDIERGNHQRLIT